MRERGALGGGGKAEGLFLPGELRDLCSGVFQWLFGAVCGCGIVLAPSLWERLHSACCTMCKSCSLGFPVACWRVKHLCSPSVFPMCLFVPYPTRIFLSWPVFRRGRHQDRQCRVPGPGSCVGWSRKGASTASATLALCVLTLQC